MRCGRASNTRDLSERVVLGLHRCPRLRPIGWCDIASADVRFRRGRMSIVTDPSTTSRVDDSRRLIAYDEHRDVSVFLSADGQVIVNDGQSRRSWISTDVERDLRDWLPPGQYELAMNALRRYSLFPLR